jgi:cobalt-zinc-cadmium efflux system membrane fusion protein
MRALLLVRNLGDRTLGWIPTLLTLGLLGGLALWGAKNEWRLPGSSSAAAADPDAEPGSIQVTDGESASASTREPIKIIEFPSASAVLRAGIHFEKVQIRPLAQYITATAMLDYEPSHLSRLSSRVTGTMWRIDKVIGDPVRKDEVIAIVESAEVGKIKADFLQDLTQVRQRTAVMNRLRSLTERGAVSDRALADAEFALREARIRLFNDQQAFLNLGLPLRLEDVDKLSEEQLVRYLRLLGLPDSVRTEQNTDTLTANLLPIKAPFDGLVVERNVTPGEVVQTVQTLQTKSLFVVADVRFLHIEINVNPQDMPLVKLDQDVAFQSESREPLTATGKVAHISPEVDPKTRKVYVHAEVEKSNGLRPNAFGTAQILVQKKDQARVIPSTAVQTDGQNSLVFVRLTPTRFQVRPVRPGLRSDNLIEIVDGLQPGEEIVTDGSFELKSELLKDRILGED